MDSAEKKKAVPPYVSYTTLSNFLERFKQSVPGRIDRGLMGSMSGAAQSQVTTALRYLGMITENGLPNPILRRYVSGDEAEHKEALREMLQVSYPFIFEDGFDLSTATASMLKEVFAKHTSATGETLGRCIAFLKDACADAGIPVSPYITQKQARTPGARKKSAPRREEKAAERPAVPMPANTHQPPPPPQIPAMTSLLLSGLFQRMPKPGTPWSHDDRERWMNTFKNVLDLEYPEV